MKRTLEQNKQLHRLIGILGIEEEQKAWLVEQFTEGCATSSSDMTVTECQALIDHLSNIVRDTNADRAQVMRRKAFAIAHELGWEDDQGKVDRERLDGWMRKYSYLHKPINAYTLHELPKLITQMEQLLP